MKTTCSLGKCPFCNSTFLGGIQLDCSKGEITICEHCLGTGCSSPDKRFSALREQLLSIDNLPPEKRDLAKIDLAKQALGIAMDVMQKSDKFST